MRNKKLLTVLSVLLALASLFVLSACKKESDNTLKVSITNKDALTATWTEGDATRELKVEFTQGGTVVTGKTYSVSSSDSGVVAVADDNKTLSAVGGGTATITVKSGDATDKVEITVIPAFKGVGIGNKKDLKNVWVLGEAGRTLNIVFNPDYYNGAKPEFTVTSSNPDVIAVGADKVTLTAKAIGTATITVTAGDYSDSAELSVRPALDSVTITNKDALSESWTDWSVDRTIEMEFAPAEYYTSENTTVDITFSVDGVLTAKGNVLTAKATGTVTVTVTVKGKSDSFTVTVERAAPTMEIADVPNFEASEEGGKMSGLENTAFTLPTVTATSCDKRDLTLSIQIEMTDANAKFDAASGRFLAPKGKYTVTYTVADPVDESKVTTKTITVGVYRTLFSWTDNTWNIENPYVDDAEQKVTNSKGGYQLATFNQTPGTIYYAEVTYDANGGVLGLAHFKGTDHSRWLGNIVNNWGQFDYKTVDFDTSIFNNGANNGNWDLNEWNDYGLVVAHAYRLTEYRGLKANADTSIHKIAIARIGDKFYTFWNDQYVCATSLDWYAEGDTVPGLFTVFFGSDSGFIHNIEYYDDAQAVLSKVDSLTHNGKDTILSYVPDSWAVDSLNTGNRNFTLRDTTEAGGVNFSFTNANTHWNGGLFSQYVYLTGNYTYSFDYKKTSGNGQIWMEMRNWRYGGEKLCLGAKFGDDGIQLIAGANQDGVAYNGFDASEGIHFTVTATRHETYVEYTLTATSKANATQTHSVTLKYGATADEANGILSYSDWDKPQIFLWHNVNCAGEYSNIAWSRTTK